MSDRRTVYTDALATSGTIDDTAELRPKHMPKYFSYSC